MDITIQPCRVSDLHTLRTISYETYDETFRPLNTPETMELYLAEAFRPAKLLAELNTPGSSFYFLFADGELAGYLKLNVAPAQSDLNDPDSLEVERIYIRQAFKGMGLGRYLIDFSFQAAKRLGKQYVWLGVWEKNTNARAFYQRLGFEPAGEHIFRMGDELQTDFVLRKAVVSGLPEG